MKAVAFYHHGSPKVLQYREDFPDPPTRKGNILINVKYCGLNHLDIWTRKGIAEKKITLPHICGCDIVGTVEIGSGKFKKGDRVMVYPGISCNFCSFCRSGKENLCRRFAIIGGLSNLNGGYAEKISVPERNTIHIPPSLDSKFAATLSVSYLTAYNMIRNTGLKRGQTLFVYGGSSGLGMAVIQIAKYFGARVITTVSSKDKKFFARKIGADVIINRTEQDIPAGIEQATNGIGADIVIDHVGSLTWKTSILSVKIGGKIAVCGVTSGNEANNIPIRTFYSKQITMVGSLMGSKSDLLHVIDLAKKKKIRPSIDSVFPLNAARYAHKLMESNKHKGKILLKI